MVVLLPHLYGKKFIVSHNKNQPFIFHFIYWFILLQAASQKIRFNFLWVLLFHGLSSNPNHLLQPFLHVQPPVLLFSLLPPFLLFLSFFNQFSNFFIFFNFITVFSLLGIFFLQLFLHFFIFSPSLFYLCHLWYMV